MSYGTYSNYGQYVSGPGMITNHNITHHSRVGAIKINNVGQSGEITEADIQRFFLENIAAKAIHDANNTGFDLPNCYPGTRKAIQRDLTKWVENLEREYPINWLYAPAGSGKTAIAKTLADSFSDYPKRYLLASFFFRRASIHQNTEQRFIATLAYQVKTNLPLVSPFITDAIKADVTIFQKDLQVQLVKLILDPLRKACEVASSAERATWPRLLVVDGLDECSGQDAQLKILDIISHLVLQMPYPLSILVSCRPEPHIRGAFQVGHLSKASLKICLPSNYNSHHDLRKFFIGKFQAVVKAHSHILPFPRDWPGKRVIDHLITKSSGQFIYASTVMKFIDVRDDNPMERLDIVLGLEKSPEDENPFAELDALYKHIFASVKRKHLTTVIRMLQVTLSQSDRQIRDHHPCKLRCGLASFLSLEPSKLEYSLGKLEGVLIDSYDSVWTPSLRFHHASLSDFLLDESRSGPYFIDISLAHTQFIVHLFPLILNYDNPNSYLIPTLRSDDPELNVDIAIRSLLNRLPFAALTNELHETLRCLADQKHLTKNKRITYLFSEMEYHATSQQKKWKPVKETIDGYLLRASDVQVQHLEETKPTMPPLNVEFTTPYKSFLRRLFCV